MLRFTAISIALGLVILVIVESGLKESLSYAREIVALLALSNAGLYWVVARNLEQRGDFVVIYLGATVLRVLFFGGFIFAVIYLDPSGASKNALFFLICYFIFTSVEIAALWFKIKAENTSKQGQKDH